MTWPQTRPCERCTGTATFVEATAHLAYYQCDRDPQHQHFVQEKDSRK